MIGSLLYVFSLLFLCYEFLILKKSDKKINLIYWIIIIIVLLFCYNSVIGFLLNLIYIPLNLISLSIINIIISSILFIKNKDNKQEYKFNKKDMIYIIILFIISLLIGYLRFGFPFSIVYETSDPGVHFWNALDFVRNDSLLNHADTVVDFSTRQFSSYLNVGILCKILIPFIGEVSLYNCYILFDIFYLFIAASLFYILINLLCKNIFKSIVLIGSILYIFGYPLNNMIFGFFYSGHAVTIIILILILLYMYQNQIINKKYNILLIFITSLTLFFTYYFYAPFVYLGMIIFFFLKDKKNFIKNFLLIILIPCVLGVLYFIFPNIGNSDMNFINQMKLDGYFYENNLYNFIVFIPFIIYYFISKIKNKDFDYVFFIFIGLILFLIGLLVLAKIELCTYYYVSKLYYVLWLFMFVITFSCLNKKIMIVISIIYLLLSLFVSLDIEKIMFKNDKFKMLDIYKFNFKNIVKKHEIFTISELKMIKSIEKYNPNNVIINGVTGMPYQKVWITAWFWKDKINYPENQIYTYLFNDYYYDPLDYNSFVNMNEKYNYYLIFYRNDNLGYYFNDNWYLNNKIEKYTYLKNDYDILNRNLCTNCTFYDYDVGFLILKK